MLNHQLKEIYQSQKYGKRREMADLICDLALIEKPTFYGWIGGKSIPRRKRSIIAQYLNIDENELFPEYETKFKVNE